MSGFFDSYFHSRKKRLEFPSSFKKELSLSANYRDMLRVANNALAQYAIHKECCNYEGTYHEHVACTCGLDKIRCQVERMLNAGKGEEAKP